MWAEKQTQRPMNQNCGPEICLHNFDQINFVTGARNTIWRKESLLINGAQKTGMPHAEK